MLMTFGRGFCELLYVSISFMMYGGIHNSPSMKTHYSNYTEKCSDEEHEEIITAIDRNKKFLGTVSCGIDTSIVGKQIRHNAQIKCINRDYFIFVLQMLEFFGEKLFKKYGHDRHMKYFPLGSESRFSCVLRKNRGVGPEYIKVCGVYIDNGEKHVKIIMLEIPNFAWAMRGVFYPEWFAVAQSHGYVLDDCKMKYDKNRLVDIEIITK